MLDVKAFNHIKKVFKDGIAQNELAGGNLLVIHKDQEIFYHEDGYADIENRFGDCPNCQKIEEYYHERYP